MKHLKLSDPSVGAFANQTFEPKSCRVRSVGPGDFDPVVHCHTSHKLALCRQDVQ
jgi:hypothetical protein